MFSVVQLLGEINSAYLCDVEAFSDAQHSYLCSTVELSALEVKMKFSSKKINAGMQK